MQSEFVYTDVHRSDAKGVHHAWVRLHADQVESKIAKFINNENNLYTTLQRFNDLEHKDSEVEYTPLAFDFDCQADVTKAHVDAQRLVSYMAHVHELGISPEEMMVYFSGNRGFHVVIKAETFDAEPMIDMNKVWRVLVSHLNKSLLLSTLDLSVYSRRRAWRVPNTIHTKTGLYKRALTQDQLLGSIESIKELAKEPADWIDIKDVI